MKYAGIVRNRLKIKSAIGNARALLALAAEHGSFDRWIWDFIGGKTIVARRRGRSDVPARTPLSDALSAELRRRGFTFVGSTIVYAFMQAAGLVNDHTLACFRRTQVAALGRAGRWRARQNPSRSPRRPNSTSAVSDASCAATRSGVSSARTPLASAVAP